MLYAGWAVSLLGAKHLCPTAPAGVSHLTLQLTTILVENNNLLKKSQKERALVRTPSLQ